MQDSLTEILQSSIDTSNINMQMTIKINELGHNIYF